MISIYDKHRIIIKNQITKWIQNYLFVFYVPTNTDNNGTLGYKA